MINYNIPQLLSKKMEEKSAVAKVDSLQQLAGTLSYPDRTKFIDQQCLHLIIQSPFAYLSLHLKGVFRFFLDHGRWDLYTFFTGINLDRSLVVPEDLANHLTSVGHNRFCSPSCRREIYGLRLS